ncbi:MFS transporter [Lactobacillus sp. Sy-1]|uniref:MFS transporter n=1 Tax=Lactobacillus sp. Sy-1 TaxID=2109645 RepID=UPI001C5B3568|nr:MFS transporter [Lactobacillus sp. Sy-1]MBW1606187.1 MFS transporter [Lactobacillus sp. Sy-1]
MTTKSRFGMVLPIILVSYFLILLDNSVVFTSTVKIAADLGMSKADVSWVTNIYALMFGSLLLLGGRLGDLYGRKVILIIGIIIFTLGSFLVGSSTSGTMIILMRALQGIGSAILAPTTLALLLDSYEGETRQKAISYYGVTAGIGASIGIIVGGLITTYVSWRWGFYINVPIGIGLIILAMIFIQKGRTRDAHLDYVGTLLSVVGLFLLVYSINGSSYRLPSFLISIGLLALFVIIEKRKSNPLMPFKLFADPERRWAYVARFLFAGIAIAYFFLVPQTLQQVYGYTPLMSALAFMPETIPQFIFGLIQSKLSNRVSNNTLLLIGVSITVIGVILQFIIGLEHGYLIGVAIPMVIFGIGQGLAFGPLTSAGVAHADDQIAGAASSAVNVFHQLGASVILSMVVALSSILATPVAQYQHEFMILVVVGILTIIAAGLIKRAANKD